MLFGIVKFSLLFSALAYGIGSGLASVVLQLQAPFTVLLAVLFAGERPSLAQGLGLGLAMVGLIAIAAGQGGTALVPFLMVVAAALAWAIANGVVKRAGSVDMLAFTVWSSLIVPLPMLGLSLAVEGPGAIAQALSQVSWIGVATLAYLVIPVSLVSVTLWNGLLGRYPAAAVAPFALLVPAIGLLAGAAVFGERQPVVVFIGCLLIGVGLAAVVFGPGRIPSGEASASRAKMET